MSAEALVLQGKSDTRRRLLASWQSKLMLGHVADKDFRLPSVGLYRKGIHDKVNSVR